MNKRHGILALLILLYNLAYSVNLSIHIYSNETFTSAIVAPVTGSYILEADGKKIDSCTTSSIYEISVQDDSLMQLKNLDHVIGTFSRIHFRSYGSKSSFMIKPAGDKTNRLYDDGLSISAVNKNLQLINMVDLEHYVSGVVQCEAGYRKPEEYYKVQAIICRTYALNNLARHINDGYELCDAVHCQVYKGVSHNEKILQAVEATKGVVIVDSDNKLIDAAFHANCGGHTLNSEDVWNLAVYYLRGITDTFCIHQPAATWKKEIPAGQWNKYIAKKEAGMRKDNTYPKSHWDSIPVGTRVFLYDKGYLLPLKDIRTDLNLRSTYFTVSDSNGMVTLNGRGYGHRIGLCQEGAIHMAELGYNHQQILHFYYHDIQLIDYSLLPFSGFN